MLMNVVHSSAWVVRHQMENILSGSPAMFLIVSSITELYNQR